MPLGGAGSAPAPLPRSGKKGNSRLDGTAKHADVLTRGMRSVEGIPGMVYGLHYA